MKNYVQKGDTFEKVAGAAIASGELVKSGKLVGVAVKDYAVGETAVAYIEGVYNIAKKAGVAFAQGDVVYFEAGEASDVVGDQMGHCHVDADAGDATVAVKLER